MPRADDHSVSGLRFAGSYLVESLKGLFVLPIMLSLPDLPRHIQAGHYLLFLWELAVICLFTFFLYADLIFRKHPRRSAILSIFYPVALFLILVCFSLDSWVTRCLKG